MVDHIRCGKFARPDLWGAWGGLVPPWVYPTGEDRQSALECPGWTQEFEGDFVGRGALISDGTRVVVVTWCRIANGARARAFDLANGTPLCDEFVEGIGPQDHSKYSNLIQLALDGDAIVIRGQEAHGHYVEAREIATGELRWTVAWPAF